MITILTLRFDPQWIEQARVKAAHLTNRLTFAPRKGTDLVTTTLPVSDPVEVLSGTYAS